MKGSLSQYNVVWDMPGNNSADSMPIGNGDIGLNVWVEQDGDLLFYISKTDAWDENGRLLKVGRVRLKFKPNPFLKDNPFLQVLKVEQGEIHIRAGKGRSEITVRIWVDANQPVVRIEAENEITFEIEASLEVWRNKKRVLQGSELDSAYGLYDRPGPVVVYPDTVLSGQKNRIVWFHRNENSAWPENMELQGLKNNTDQNNDPLLHRTFGGVIQSDGLVTKDSATLESSQPGNQYLLSIYLVTCQTRTAEEWLDILEKTTKSIASQNIETARTAHQKWWKLFWDRSWIKISGADDAKVVTRSYLLQRFVSACGGRGRYPVKFNGSIFTADWGMPEYPYDADFRLWGGPYWFQNTRLIYWPMLASGDFDMMRPFFKMYRNALDLARKRTVKYFRHEGAFFPETMQFWGTYANHNYGWERKGRDMSYVDNTYIRYCWSGGLELTAMGIDYFLYTQDSEFFHDVLLPLADAIIQFYDQHYSRDERNKIVFKPAQALETWQEAVNPLPEIAGLSFVLNGLLNLPDDVINDEQRSAWQRIRQELPEIPTRQVDDKTLLSAAAELIGPMKNSENPELYAVFPYRLYGIGKDGLEMARLTFAKRRVKGNRGWRQDDIQAAYLGLAHEARNCLAERFANKNGDARFPAFWGPNFDWIPDQDHGNVGMIALQAMLIQTKGDKIFIFPAWPKEWDVNFKMHIPMKTTVEGVYRDGELQKLKITPEYRKRDVIILQPQKNGAVSDI